MSLDIKLNIIHYLPNWLDMLRQEQKQLLNYKKSNQVALFILRISSMGFKKLVNDISRKSEDVLKIINLLDKNNITFKSY